MRLRSIIRSTLLRPRRALSSTAPFFLTKHNLFCLGDENGPRFSDSPELRALIGHPPPAERSTVWALPPGSTLPAAAEDPLLTEHVRLIFPTTQPLREVPVDSSRVVENLKDLHKLPPNQFYQLSADLKSPIKPVKAPAEADATMRALCLALQQRRQELVTSLYDVPERFTFVAETEIEVLRLWLREMPRKRVTRKDVPPSEYAAARAAFIARLPHSTLAMKAYQDYVKFLELEVKNWFIDEEEREELTRYLRVLQTWINEFNRLPDVGDTSMKKFVLNPELVSQREQQLQMEPVTRRRKRKTRPAKDSF